MRWAAAAVLVALAVRGAVVAVRHHRDPARTRGERGALATPGRAYLALLGLTLLNPATIVYFGALVLGRRAVDGLDVGSEAVLAAAFVASASWQLLLVGGGSLVGRLLTGPRGRLVTALVASLVIAALAVWLVVPG
jgi:arginine exporter protein ArgO